MINIYNNEVQLRVPVWRQLENVRKIVKLVMDFQLNRETDTTDELTFLKINERAGNEKSLYT